MMIMIITITMKGNMLTKTTAHSKQATKQVRHRTAGTLNLTGSGSASPASPGGLRASF